MIVDVREGDQSKLALIFLPEEFSEWFGLLPEMGKNEEGIAVWEPTKSWVMTSDVLTLSEISKQR